MRKIHSCCVQNLDTTDDKISQIHVGRCTSPLATILLIEYLPNHTLLVVGGEVKMLEAYQMLLDDLYLNIVTDRHMLEVTDRRMAL